MGETDKVGTNAESGTRAGLRCHRWYVCVKDGEGGRGSECDKGNLIKIEGSLRDGVGSKGNHEAFDEVLDSTLKQFFQINHIVEHSLILMI